MKSIRIILPLVGGLLATQAHALDFAGNWDFNYNGNLSLVSVNDSTSLGIISGLVNASLINGNVSASGQATTITQSSVSNFSVPVSAQVTSGLFNGFTAFSGTDAGVVTGSSVSLTGPSFLSASVLAGVPAVLGLQLRLALPNSTLSGNVTGVDVGNTLAFGDRAYSVTGTSGNLGLLTLQARLNTVIGPVGSFVDAGLVQVSTNSWSLNRASAPVPEPASLLVLGTGFCALIRRRAKRRTI